MELHWQRLGQEVERMVTQDQIDSFHQFASSQIAAVGGEFSLDQLYCLWRTKHPLPQELVASVTALKSAYADLEAGDTGRDARLKRGVRVAIPRVIGGN